MECRGLTEAVSHPHPKVAPMGGRWLQAQALGLGMRDREAWGWGWGCGGRGRTEANAELFEMRSG